jgi:hypothetical protein
MKLLRPDGVVVDARATADASGILGAYNELVEASLDKPLVGPPARGLFWHLVKSGKIIVWEGTAHLITGSVWACGGMQAAVYDLDELISHMEENLSVSAKKDNKPGASKRALAEEHVRSNLTGSGLMHWPWMVVKGND